MSVRELGVGVVYWPGLDEILRPCADLVDVIEIEPQVFWYPSRDMAHGYHLNSTAFMELRNLPQPKLVHGVGFPVGGSRAPDPMHLPPLLESVNSLDAVWASEHLSFNTAHGQNGAFNTGFFLPPRQTEAGVRAAARSIREVAESLSVPFAIELGVNYLKPRKDEMPDGEFYAAVAEEADCGLLLDLHNLWSNERNGRERVSKTLNALPLERVWEVHLAGGAPFRGFWLDAHSGAVPPSVMSFARDIVPNLPNLGAVIFEMMSEHARQLDSRKLRAQLQDIRDIWNLRRPGITPLRALPLNNKTEYRSEFGSTRQTNEADTISPREWEDTLAGLVTGAWSTHPLAEQLRSDPGTELYRELIRASRSGMVINNLKLTCRLIMLAKGESRLLELLHAFWCAQAPAQFAIQETEHFAAFLRGQKLDIPHLYEVLDFEATLMNMELDQCSRKVRFGCDPRALLETLGSGQLPAGDLAAGVFDLEIVADGVWREAG